MCIAGGYMIRGHTDESSQGDEPCQSEPQMLPRLNIQARLGFAASGCCVVTTLHCLAALEQLCSCTAMARGCRKSSCGHRTMLAAAELFLRPKKMVDGRRPYYVAAEHWTAVELMRICSCCFHVVVKFGWYLSRTRRSDLA